MNKKPTARDVSATWWRQVGFWGLTVNMIVGFPVIAAVVVARPETDVSSIVVAFGSILTAWVAAAGIRQWGKNTGSEIPQVETAPSDGLGD